LYGVLLKLLNIINIMLVSGTRGTEGLFNWWQGCPQRSSSSKKALLLWCKIKVSSTFLSYFRKASLALYFGAIF